MLSESLKCVQSTNIEDRDTFVNAAGGASLETYKKILNDSPFDPLTVRNTSGFSPMT